MADFLPFTRPSVDEETIAGVAQVLRSGWLASGPQVAALEKALSEFCGGRPARAFTSATEALEVALQVLGVGPGDEVLVPAMTFAATANVVLRRGARPVFADVDLSTRNLDVEHAAAALTPRTRVMMPVHFAGLACDMDPLLALAESRNITVLEDAAHAIGTEYRGRRIGSFGHLAAFSFHPNKNMTTLEGGALTVADAALLPAIERARFHGIVKDADGMVDVVEPGGKHNLTDVAARVGLGQLRALPGFNARRRALAERYLRLWPESVPALLPPAGEGHSWHMFAPLIPFADLGWTRAGFIRAMAARSIGVGVHYPALHTMTLYRGLGWNEGDCPNAARIGRDTVTLPLFPAMADSDVERVCGALAEVLARPEGAPA